MRESCDDDMFAILLWFVNEWRIGGKLSMKEQISLQRMFKIREKSGMNA